MSKKFVLAMFVLALIAAPSFAQGSGPSKDSNGAESGGAGDFDDLRGGGRGGRGGNGGGSGNNFGDRPVAPVPEPGTMALASMGLIALGVAARGRKS